MLVARDCRTALECSPSRATLLNWKEMQATIMRRATRVQIGPDSIRWSLHADGNTLYVALDLHFVEWEPPILHPHVSIFYSVGFESFCHLHVARQQAVGLRVPRVTDVWIVPYSCRHFQLASECSLLGLCKALKWAIMQYADKATTLDGPEDLIAEPANTFHVTWNHAGNPMWKEDDVAVVDSPRVSDAVV